jgi:hypothetical protein
MVIAWVRERNLTITAAPEEVSIGASLPSVSCGKLAPMRSKRLLQILFASLITLGLAVAPFAVPAAAASHAASDGGMMQMSDMFADMPCCPDEQKQSNCKDCPLLAICMAKVLRSEPSSTGLPVDSVTSRTLRPLDEPTIAGLTRPPPDQPPRTLV